MLTRLSPIFAEYQELTGHIDAVFEQVRSTYSNCVTCTSGCSDCCHALFDLPLVEALYINQKFAELFSYGPERSGILEAAGNADRAVYKIKKALYKATTAGEEDTQVLTQAAQQRVRCPLLSAENTCQMYEFRPITCRIYGIPTAIGGKGHCCGKTAFSSGGSYPTIQMDKVHERLAALSTKICTTLGSRYEKLDALLVPLSMALLTQYDAQYLGFGEPEKRREE